MLITYADSASFGIPYYGCDAETPFTILPGNLIDDGLSPSQIAERFVNENHKEFLEIAKEFDEDNYQALNEFMKLSESELHILKYFLKLIKLKNS